MRRETSFGIALFIDGALVSSNRTLLTGGPKAKGITSIGPGSILSKSSFRGSGLAALILMPCKEIEANRKALLDNDYSTFQAAV